MPMCGTAVEHVDRTVCFLIHKKIRGGVGYNLDGSLKEWWHPRPRAFARNGVILRWEMDISPSSGNNAISDFVSNAYGKRGVSGNIVETSCWRYGKRRSVRYECSMNESERLGDRASVHRFSRWPRSRELPALRLSSEWISLISLSLAWLGHLLQYCHRTLGRNIAILSRN